MTATILFPLAFRSFSSKEDFLEYIQRGNKYTVELDEEMTSKFIIESNIGMNKPPNA